MLSSLAACWLSCLSRRMQDFPAVCLLHPRTDTSVTASSCPGMALLTLAPQLKSHFEALCEPRATTGVTVGR